MNRIDAAFDAVIGQLRECTERAAALRAGAYPAKLARRPAENSWSAVECVEHLSRTTEAFLPLLAAASDDLRRRGAAARRPPRRDFVGWMLARTLEPPARMRARTPAPFEPSAIADPLAAFTRFDDLQQKLENVIDAARGLPLDKVKVNSPFDRRIRYNAWSALHVIASHQRRHLEQARLALSAQEK